MSDFMHLPVGLGYVTLSIMEESGDIYVSSAFCSPLDQFSRKKGRLISEGRNKAGKWMFVFTPNKNASVKEQVRSMFDDFFEHGFAGVQCDIPRWLDDEAKFQNEWLKYQCA